MTKSYTLVPFPPDCDPGVRIPAGWEMRQSSGASKARAVPIDARTSAQRGRSAGEGRPSAKRGVGEGELRTRRR